MGALLLFLLPACTGYASPEPPEAPAFPPAHTPVRPSPDTADTEPPRHPPAYYTDEDQDGYTEAGGDCDDARSRTSPRRHDYCNGIDDNCDGQVDEGCPEHPVRAFWGGTFGDQGSQNPQGETTWTYTNVAGEELCRLTTPWVDQGMDPVRPCPGCLWEFAVQFGAAVWSGDRCDDIVNLEVDTMDEIGAWAGSNQYYAYAPRWEVEGVTQLGYPITYSLGPTVLEGSAYTEVWSAAVWTSYIPWALYQVEAVGDGVRWQRYWGGDLQGDYYYYLGEE